MNLSATIGRGAARRLVSAIIALFLLIPAAAYAKTVTVESGKARIRSGAGNYYEVIYRAAKGTELEVLEEAGGWLKVKLQDGGTGYVSARSLKGRGGEKPARKSWINDAGVGAASSSGMMAATKGIVEVGDFVRTYAKKHGLDEGVIEEFNNIPFTPSEYLAFRETLSTQGAVEVNGLSGEPIPDLDREVGAAVAMRLASMGVHRDAKERKYISMVGTALLESTPLDDEFFVFIVIDSPRVQSFATPGGYVFITTGALKQMETEAQLAGVLSHELTHVVQRHGIEELERQRTRIESRELMDSLDKEVEKLDMDRGDRELMEEMEDMADLMYERLISGRKKESEDEADILGTHIMYNTGYNARGLRDFVLGTGRLDTEMKGSDYSHNPPEERAAAMDRLIKKKSLVRKDRKEFQKRFEENTR